MIKRTLKDFDIRQIAASGQCFRMEEKEDAVRVIAGNRYLEIRETGECSGDGKQEKIFAFSCSDEEYDGFWREYFDLDYDYGRVKAGILPEDRYLRAAAVHGGGIRILRQDLWETLVSFLISQQNHIPRIRRCIRLLCEACGERKETEDGTVFYGFPSPENVAALSLEELQNCNLGYRAKYIRKTAEDAAAGRLCLEKIGGMGYEEAREALKKCFGVGDKVADCVCLFALHHMEAFPVDTHIRQVLEREYPRGFPFAQYKETAGILQQYMFYYELTGPEGA